ncbi:MAG: signal peptidase II [Candidatus Cyclonatronum sp.]|uniref:signal peptidase II n=1 Tax=Cyclonatronum sp. TaxID=3024185 RepID=UPI0025C08E41|nr:signal peptidase II [Cyclonatronum sp.]MCH8486227.1 signal peptidase II [Cyclonatronum sp.]
MNPKSEKLAWFSAMAVIVVILDQWSKTVVRTSPELHRLTLIDGWLAFNYTTNPGMAMGISFAPTFVISIIAILATIGIVWYTISVMDQAPKGFVICMGLVIGGALGNIADRLYMAVIKGYGSVLEGAVVDFIHFTWIWPAWVPWVGGSPSFPYIFNVADVAISTAIIILLVFSKWLLPADPPKEAAPSEVPVQQTEAITTDTPETETASPDSEKPETTTQAASETDLTPLSGDEAKPTKPA